MFLATITTFHFGFILLAWAFSGLVSTISAVRASYEIPAIFLSFAIGAPMIEFQTIKALNQFEPFLDWTTHVI